MPIKPAVLTAGLLFSVFAQADPMAFKVERLVIPRADRYSTDPVGLERPLVQIGIKATEQNNQAVPVPERELMNQAMLIGTEGIATDTFLIEYEKRCEYLCGDEGEECHYTAIIDHGNHRIGIPLLAVTGLDAKPRDFELLDASLSDITQIDIEQQPLAWPASRELSLELDNTTVSFTESQQGRNSFSYEASAPECKLFDYPDTSLSRLSCNGVEFLLSDRQPLLISYADYNVSRVEVINRFKAGEQTYYTVLLALKAYTAYGLLTHGKNGWQFIVNPADWAQLC